MNLEINNIIIMLKLFFNFILKFKTTYDESSKESSLRGIDFVFNLE